MNGSTTLPQATNSSKPKRSTSSGRMSCARMPSKPSAEQSQLRNASSWRRSCRFQRRSRGSSAQNSCTMASASGQRWWPLRPIMSEVMKAPSSASVAWMASNSDSSSTTWCRLWLAITTSWRPSGRQRLKSPCTKPTCAAMPSAAASSAPRASMAGLRSRHSMRKSVTPRSRSSFATRISVSPLPAPMLVIRSRRPVRAATASIWRA